MQGRKKGVKMRLQNMFKKTGERENPVRKGRLRRRPEAPEGLLKKCNKCGAAILSAKANRWRPVGRSDQWSIYLPEMSWVFQSSCIQKD